MSPLTEKVKSENIGLQALEAESLLRNGNKMRRYKLLETKVQF